MNHKSSPEAPENQKVKDYDAVCKECGVERGHKEGCLTGRREFEEWRQLFGGRETLFHEGVEQPAGKIEVRQHTKITSASESHNAPKAQPGPEMTARLAAIRQHLIKNVLVFAYNFATNKGKVTLQDIFRAKRERPKEVSTLLKQDVIQTLKGGVKDLIIEEEKAKHLERMKHFIDMEFKKAFEENNLPINDSNMIIKDLIRNLDTYCSDIEAKDQGAVKILNNLLAQMFLGNEDIKSLYKYLS